jgi:short-subunit dehydrogenase
VTAPGNKPRTALVTGASIGIGLELARLFAADRTNLVLVGRNRTALQDIAHKLQTTHPISVRYEARDLSEPGSARRLWSDLADAGILIDVLVNNAGSGIYGNLEDADADALERMLQVNVVALTSLTRLALPGMKARGWGRILNVGSVVGYQPAGPRMAGYFASKAYVLSFSKALARELAGTGVSVTALCPGLTDSSFEARSGAGRTFLYKLLPKMSASAVAHAGYAGLKRGAAVVLPGALTKLLAFAGEFPPRRIAVEVNRLLLLEARSDGDAPTDKQSVRRI